VYHPRLSATRVGKNLHNACAFVVSHSTVGDMNVASAAVLERRRLPSGHPTVANPDRWTPLPASPVRTLKPSTYVLVAAVAN